MNTREEIAKLATLLNGEEIFFDHNSYDLAEDIPHIIVGGKRVDIDSVIIPADASYIEVYSGNDKYTLSLVEDGDYTFDLIDKFLEESKVDTLLYDIYYQHPKSYEIGDYEMDFLKL